jgi:hypothetical protein
MGQQRGDLSIAALTTTRWSVAMTKRKTETVNDLSRCLDPLDMDATLIAVINSGVTVVDRPTISGQFLGQPALRGLALGTRHLGD